MDFPLQSAGSRVYGLSSCSAWAQLLWDIWALSRPGVELVSLALEGGLPTTGPPGKPPDAIILSQLFHSPLSPHQEAL